MRGSAEVTVWQRAQLEQFASFGQLSTSYSLSTHVALFGFLDFLHLLAHFC